MWKSRFLKISCYVQLIFSLKESLPSPGFWFRKFSTSTAKGEKEITHPTAERGKYGQWLGSSNVINNNRIPHFSTFQTWSTNYHEKSQRRPHPTQKKDKKQKRKAEEKRQDRICFFYAWGTELVFKFQHNLRFEDQKGHTWVSTIQPWYRGMSKRSNIAHSRVNSKSSILQKYTCGKQSYWPKRRG